jgi:hypothetical protein
VKKKFLHSKRVVTHIKKKKNETSDKNKNFKNQSLKKNQCNLLAQNKIVTKKERKKKSTCLQL